ncbi:aldehyde dehydrogenase [Lenzites betulinus]|nr:aldehyde dehydrogenase [Lenzites betulinus]
MPIETLIRILLLPTLAHLQTSDPDTDQRVQIYARLSKTFQAGTTRPLAYRRRQLLQLARLLQDNHTALEDAQLTDLNKPRLEATVSEIAATITATLAAVDSLEEWAAPEPRPTKEAWRANWNGTVYKGPKGVALIIAPWNYPLILTLNPFIGAIAAGCPAVIKPSELVPATSQLLADLFPRYLDPDAFAIVQGAVVETTHLLNLRWAHILYTGNGTVGRIVAAAAAKHLTPITLELGGKSAVVIADDADLDIAARRILHGKIQNAGQLCVSPDYVLVSRSRVDALAEGFEKAWHQFWPEGDSPLTGTVPVSNIINERHLARLVDLLKRTKGKPIFGGEVHEGIRLAPTVLRDVGEDDVLMEEEIFGPILPIVAVEDIDDAIRVVNSKSSPLVIYLFTDKEEIQNKFIHQTLSGELVFNDVVMQLAGQFWMYYRVSPQGLTNILVTELPFGGVGESGYGAWAGKNSFDTFSHYRGSINITNALEPHLQGRYRPYTEDKYQFFCAPSKVKIPDA